MSYLSSGASVLCSGSGIDTPLIALKDLLGTKAELIKYRILVFKRCCLMPLFWGWALNSLTFRYLRSNSEMDKRARKFMRENHERPEQYLGSSYSQYIVLQSSPSLPVNPPPYMVWGVMTTSSMWKQNPWKRRQEEQWCCIHLHSSVLKKSANDLSPEVVCYCAGFPCQPYSQLNVHSALLQDEKAKPFFRVLKHIQIVAPPVSCFNMSVQICVEKWKTTFDHFVLHLRWCY